MSSEQETKLKEIFDILLSAGYFRCRIPSISQLDKLIGGLAWCITCANFDIDIEFSDDMNMGQKIKIMEKIVNSLTRMGCPHPIQPYQIRGLDVKNIYPVIQWLINFVLETRDLREDFNKSVSIQRGHDVYNKGNIKSNSAEILVQQNLKDRRLAKNSKAGNYSFNDPLRVYSSLMEFDDKTAIRTYNRLSLYLAGEDKKKKQESSSPSKGIQLGRGKKKEAEDEEKLLESTLFVPDTDNTEDINPNALDMIEIRKDMKKGAVSGQNVLKIVVENRDNIVKGMKENQEDDTEEEIASMLKRENEFFEDQKANIKKQIEKLTEKEQTRKVEYDQLSAEYSALQKKFKEIKDINDQMTQTSDVINQKLKKLKSSIPAAKVQSIEELIKKKNELKQIKSSLKKNVKQEMVKVQIEKEEIEEAWPIYSEPISEDLMKEYNSKKERYDNKYKEFAKVNQEISVLQRKIELYPSNIETAQYYKRFVELYEKINFEMELYKDNYAKYNNMQDVKAIAAQQVEIMKAFKDGVMSAGKNKSKKEDFLKNLTDTQKGLLENQKRSTEALGKVKAGREKTSEMYTLLVSQERMYYSLLRELQLEYQKNEKLFEILNIQKNEE